MPQAVAAGIFNVRLLGLFNRGKEAVVFRRDHIGVPMEHLIFGGLTGDFSSGKFFRRVSVFKSLRRFHLFGNGAPCLNVLLREDHPFDYLVGIKRSAAFRHRIPPVITE